MALEWQSHWTYGLSRWIYEQSVVLLSEGPQSCGEASGVIQEAPCFHPNPRMCFCHSCRWYEWPIGDGQITACFLRSICFHICFPPPSLISFALKKTHRRPCRPPWPVTCCSLRFRTCTSSILNCIEHGTFDEIYNWYHIEATTGWEHSVSSVQARITILLHSVRASCSWRYKMSHHSILSVMLTIILINWLDLGASSSVLSCITYWNVCFTKKIFILKKENNSLRYKICPYTSNIYVWMSCLLKSLTMLSTIKITTYFNVTVR